MADYQTGIDIIRDQDGALVFECLLLDSAGAKVTSGDTAVRVWEVQADGSLHALDFSDYTFKSTALTTASAAATHRTVDNATYDTGVWTLAVAHANLGDFTEEYRYIVEFANENASPQAIPRKFQYGGTEGAAASDVELTAAHGDGSWLTGTAIGIGAGLNPVTVTLNDGDGDPVNGQIMVVRNEDETTVAAIDITDVDGVAAIQLDDGIYTVRFGGFYACIAGGVGAYSFSNPYTLTVSGTTSATFTCTGLSLATGGLTFEEMVGLLRIFIVNTFGEAQENMFSRALLKQLINMGYQELGQKLKWRREDCTTSAVADTYAYDVSLSSREWDLVQYYDDSSEKSHILRELSLAEFREKYNDNDTSAVPVNYARYGDEIYLYPVPDDGDDTFTISCVMDLADMTEDDETPPYPPHLHPIIVDLAIAQVYRLAGQAQLSAATESYADTQIARERTDTTVRRTSGNMKPPGM